jgi:hypothetical protein
MRSTKARPALVRANVAAMTANSGARERCAAGSAAAAYRTNR